MLLVLLALALVAVVLLVSSLARTTASRRRPARTRTTTRDGQLEVRDPGRERRAEQRARELLRSCVNDEEWAMYRDLGFIRVNGRGRRDFGPDDDDLSTGSSHRRSSDRPTTPVGVDRPENPVRPAGAAASRASSYAYLIYPHKPIVAYVTGTRRLLSEYCVEFPDMSGAITGSRLPDSDDVLAKWMALTGDEQRLIRSANMHLPGRQLDPARVRRDLWRLSEWERQRRRSASAPPHYA